MEQIYRAKLSYVNSSDMQMYICSVPHVLGMVYIAYMQVSYAVDNAVFLLKF